MRTAHLLITAPLAVALLGGAAAPALAAAPATPGIGVAPAQPQPGGVGYFVNDVAAGATVTDQAVVANPGASPVDVLVYPVDGLTSSTTGAVYGDRGQPLHGAGQLVSSPAFRLTVAAHSRRLVDVTVHIPTSATPGDHLAGIAFENTQSSSRTAGALTVRTVNRSVIGLLVRVAGPALTAMHVDAARLGTLGGFGTAAIDVTMTNTGGRLVKPQLQIIVDGPAGYHRSLARQLDTVLPGDRITDPVAWPDRLAAGTYRITTSLSAPGMTGSRLTALVRLGHPIIASHAGERAVTAAPARGRVSLALLGSALVVALSAAAAGLAALRRRRGSGPAAGRHGQPTTGRHRAQKVGAGR